MIEVGQPTILRSGIDKPDAVQGSEVENKALNKQKTD